ncbi:MAG TPA: phosphate ABC transporter, permease protein PstA, partial [Mycobacterium sp.]|nr:phosphate ABC transporter, permease protein PstA [Mycobacterium sp.]
MGPVAVRRKTANVVFWTCCFGCLSAVIVPTLWMLIGVVSRA